MKKLFAGRLFLSLTIALTLTSGCSTYPSKELITLEGTLVEIKEQRDEYLQIFPQGNSNRVYFIKFERHNQEGEKIYYSYYAYLPKLSEPDLNQKVRFRFRYATRLGKIVNVDSMGPAVYGQELVRI